MRQLILIAGLTLGGCGSMPLYLDVMETNGTIKVDRSIRPDADYDVRFRGNIDPGYNPSDPVSRHEMARQVLRDRCRRPVVIGDDQLPGTDSLLGTDRPVYVVHLKCG